LSIHLGFVNARTWLAEVREHADPHVSCILVGNKIDLCEDPAPSEAGISLTSSSPPDVTSLPIRSVRKKNTASRTAMKSKVREVTHAEAEQWAKEEGMLFVEASAKSGLNVERAFVDASCDILVKIKQGVFDDPNRVRLLSSFRLASRDD
jgi:Ras-related protein Rab-2A